MERSLRRLNGMTAQHRREIEQVQDALWSYYHQLKLNLTRTKGSCRVAIE